MRLLCAVTVFCVLFFVLFFLCFAKYFPGSLCFLFFVSGKCFLSFDDSEYTLSLKVSYPVCCSKLRRYCSYSFTFHDRDATMDWMDFIPERAGMSLPSDKKCMVYIVEESA